MNKKKEKSKKEEKNTKEETEKVIKKKTVTKKNSSFINFILFLILIAGLAWLGYTNGYFGKNKQAAGTMKNSTQVEKFINENGKMLFSDLDFEVKNTEKENGIWRSIVDIDGKLQDFYITTDGQIIIATETLKKIMKSDKEETIANVDEKGMLKIDDNLKKQVKEFIEKNLVQPNTKIDIKEITKEHGLIKIVTTSQGQEQPLYVTTDGKRLVFGLISLEDYKKQITEQKKAQEKASSVSAENKKDKPIVEYFVMSYCPYGTQFEKGFIPVLKLLGGKIDAQLKFVNYAMHSKKELDQNLVQYCIQKEQPAKLYSYLNCFLSSKGGSEEGINNCLKSTGIDQTKLNSCVTKTDKEFKVSENYKDKSTWKGQFPTFNVNNADNEKYGVAGSPTLVINGQTISTARDSASLLKAVCSGFKNAPEECKKELSSKAPAPGFGTSQATGASSSGGCAQ